MQLAAGRLWWRRWAWRSRRAVLTIPELICPLWLSSTGPTAMTNVLGPYYKGTRAAGEHPGGERKYAIRLMRKDSWRGMVGVETTMGRTSITR
jgi:hypothetical protein